MDLNYVLSWMVGLGSGFSALTSFVRFRLQLPGWLAIHSALFGAVVLGALTHQYGAGYATAGCWLAFVVLPMSAARKHFDLVSEYRLEEALPWARIAAWLHPFDGLPAQAKYFTALLLADRGQRERARVLLRQLRSASGFERLAKLAERWLDDDWEAIVEHVESRPVGTRDLRLAPWYVRGLGECGRAEQMLAVYLAMPIEVRHSLVLQVQVAAFLGRVDLVQRIQERALTRTPPSQLEYWLAVAEQASGQGLDAKLRLGKLRQEAAIENRVSTRMRSPAVVVDTSAWSAESRDLLQRFERLILEPPSSLLKPVARPWATWIVTLLFLVAFALELPGGSEDERNLIALGALLLPHHGSALDLAWRFLAAGFLHYGPVHLGLNVLCFWIVGRLLEREYGYPLLLTSFLAGSVGAFALAYVYLATPAMPPTILVGGSAGVYGLVGALGTFSLVGYVAHKSRLFRHRLGVVVVIVGAQLLFDWFTPITSSFLHLAGLTTGALVSLPWAVRKLRTSKKRAAIRAS